MGPNAWLDGDPGLKALARLSQLGPLSDYFCGHVRVKAHVFEGVGVKKGLW